jgi:hypothetical protein
MSIGTNHGHGLPGDNLGAIQNSLSLSELFIAKYEVEVTPGNRISDIQVSITHTEGTSPAQMLQDAVKAQGGDFPISQASVDYLVAQDPTLLIPATESVRITVQITSTGKVYWNEGKSREDQELLVSSMGTQGAKLYELALGAMAHYIATDRSLIGGFEKGPGPNDDHDWSVRVRTTDGSANFHGSKTPVCLTCGFWSDAGYYLYDYATVKREPK